MNLVNNPSISRKSFALPLAVKQINKNYTTPANTVWKKIERGVLIGGTLTGIALLATIETIIGLALTILSTPLCFFDKKYTKFFATRALSSSVAMTVCASVCIKLLACKLGSILPLAQNQDHPDLFVQRPPLESRQPLLPNNGDMGQGRHRQEP